MKNMTTEIMKMEDGLKYFKKCKQAGYEVTPKIEEEKYSIYLVEAIKEEAYIYFFHEDSYVVIYKGLK